MPLILLNVDAAVEHVAFLMGTCNINKKHKMY